MVKVKLRLKNKLGNQLVLVPVLAYVPVYTKDGQEISVEEFEQMRAMLDSKILQLEEDPSNTDLLDEAVAMQKNIDSVKESNRLSENTEFWREFPAARFELVADDETKVTDFNEGDVFDVTLTKI